MRAAKGELSLIPTTMLFLTRSGLLILRRLFFLRITLGLAARISRPPMTALKPNALQTHPADQFTSF